MQLQQRTAPAYHRHIANSKSILYHGLRQLIVILTAAFKKELNETIA